MEISEKDYLELIKPVYDEAKAEVERKRLEDEARWSEERRHNMLPITR